MRDRRLDAPPLPTPGGRGAVVDGERAVHTAGREGAGRGEPPRWVAPAVVGAVAAAATGLLAVRTPYASGSYGFCPFLTLTGLWCPARGGLRAVHELTQLDLAAAWAMNPLLVLAVPVLVVAWALWLARGLRGRAPGVVGGRAWTAWAVLAVAVGFTVARNVPVLEPWLAPV
jgi:hypothetical protein